MNEYERVRERVAKLLCDKQNPIMWKPEMGNRDASFWDEEASTVYKNIYRRVADQILSLEGICIKADVQSLPPIPKQYRPCEYITDVYSDGWRNGYKWLKDKTKSFVKVIKKEEKG